MSDCQPDLVHLVDLQSVQIEDLQELETILLPGQCCDIFTSFDVEWQPWFTEPRSFSRWITSF